MAFPVPTLWKQGRDTLINQPLIVYACVCLCQRWARIGGCREGVSKKGKASCTQVEWDRVTCQMRWGRLVLKLHYGLKRQNPLTWWDVGQPQEQTATVVLENKMLNLSMHIRAISYSLVCLIALRESTWVMYLNFKSFWLVELFIWMKKKTCCTSSPHALSMQYPVAPNSESGQTFSMVFLAMSSFHLWLVTINHTNATPDIDWLEWRTMVSPSSLLSFTITSKATLQVSL